ncbi:hypothetical protein D3C81_1904460 [compost metagenome]
MQQPDNRRGNDISPKNRMRKLTNPFEPGNPRLSAKHVELDDRSQCSDTKEHPAPLHERLYPLGTAAGQDRKKQEKQRDIQETLHFAASIERTAP